MENSSLSLMANSSLSLMATEGLTRDKYAYLARRAQQAGRYEEMVSFMEKLVVGSSSADEELTDKERDLLCDAYKNVIGSRRAALLILSSIEQKEESLNNNEEHASLVKRYRSKVESELLKIFDGVVELLDEYLVPSASTSESSEASSFYQKMKKDCHRFLDKNHHPLALSPMATEELTRDQYVYFAKLAKQAKRYEEMASFMEKVVVGSSSVEEFTDEERDLLYVAYKNVIGSLRKAWRILSSIEKNDENASLVKEYRSTVETQLSEMCSGIVKLLDDHLLVSSASSSESKVFYWKMKGDCYYANKDALLAYKSAMHIAMADLAPTHPIRLGLGLGHSITKQTIEEAITELDTLDEESYMDRTLVKQLLRDKLTLGTSNLQGEIELSRDVLAIIVKGLCRDDFVRFSGVCKLWRSVAVENMICLPINLFPGLVARVSEEENETRSLLLLNHETGYFEENSNLVIPNGHVCRGSAFGWLFMTTDELDTLLLNPFSGSEIKLPSVRTLPDRISQRFNPISKSYIQKAIISSNPSSQIPFVFIFYGGEEHSRCAFCRPGDQSWIPLNCPGNNMDAIYYNDQFYVLAFPGSIRSFKIQAVQADYSVSETLVALAPTQHFRTCTARLYLVELNGEFFKLTRVLTREITDEDGEIWRKYGVVPYVAVSSDEELLHEEQGFSGTVILVEPVDSESVEEPVDSESVDEEPVDSESVEESVESAEDVIDDNVDAFLENNYVDIDDDIESFVTDDERLAFLDNYQDNNDDGKVKFRYQITGFKIQKFEAESWVDVEHFGEAALFLGYNNTFSVQASEFRGCIPSSIYFSGTEGLRGRIFNLTDGTFTSPRPHPEDEDASQPPAVWVDYTSRLLGVADLWFDN